MTASPDAIERALRETTTPAPPADLAARIKHDIPSAEELRDLATGGANDDRTPGAGRWLRLAATLLVAGLAGTVAWQTLGHRGIEPVSDLPATTVGFRAPNEAPSPAPPRVSPQPARRQAEPQDAASSANESRSRDLEQGARYDALSPSLSARELRDAGPAQPVEIAESIPAAKAKPRRELEVGIEGGIVGGVSGGVAGGVVGGVPGGVPSGVASPAPSEPAPAPPSRARDEESLRKNEAYAREYERQHEAKSSTGSPGQAGQVEVPLRVTSKEAAAEALPDTMIFRDAGTNRFVVTADDALSTFALDVDTGSYTLARSYLERGTLPPPAAIRLEEFVNAMTYDDPAPRDEDFALFAEGGESPYPDAAGLSLLRFAVKAREIDASDRKPANLTFVVDVSGSMDRENRLGLVKRALGLLLDELRSDDRIALVVYGTNGRVLLHHTPDKEAIRRAIAELRPEGSTNAEEGLRLAYDLADEGWRKGEINRILLCSDGVANVGATGPESILARIGNEARRGIQLTTIGFGMGNYNDALLEQLADQGDGSYHYVDALDEARKVFVENLTGTLQHVAKDAKIQVEWNPRAVDRWRLLGYENRDVADRDFRNDAIDAGEVGAGQAATALYEVRLRGGLGDAERIATLRVRWKSVDGKTVRETSRDLRAGDLARSFDRGNRDLRTAALAAMFAERLKGTRAGVEIGWRDLRDRARELARDDPRDPDLRDLATLVDRAAGLSRDADDDRPGRSDRRPRDNGRLDEPN